MFPIYISRIASCRETIKYLSKPDATLVVLPRIGEPQVEAPISWATRILEKPAELRAADYRKPVKPYLHMALSWAPGVQVDDDTILTAACDFGTFLGLEDRPGFFAVHHDRPHRHVHMLFSLLSPDGRKVAPLRTWRRMWRWAEEYAIAHGWRSPPPAVFASSPTPRTAPALAAWLREHQARLVRMHGRLYAVDLPDERIEVPRLPFRWQAVLRRHIETLISLSRALVVDVQLTSGSAEISV